MSSARAGGRSSLVKLPTEAREIESRAAGDKLSFGFREGVVLGQEAK